MMPPIAPQGEIPIAFRALKKRESVLANTEMDAINFYPDMRLIPFNITPGIIKVVKSRPFLREPTVERSYTMVSHGWFSHQWSLLPDAITGPIVRPLVVCDTAGKSINSAVIRDLSFQGGSSIETPKAYHVALFNDTWSHGHMEFAVCEDYRYEWRYSGQNEYYLWRERLADKTMQPAARISPCPLFRNPMSDCGLWSFEVDEDKIDPIIGFASAFILKRIIAPTWYLPSARMIKPPEPLIDYAFQDIGEAFQTSSKFYSDWESEVPARASLGKPPHLIKVFSSNAIAKYALPDAVLEALNFEATSNVRNLRAKYGLL